MTREEGHAMPEPTKATPATEVVAALARRLAKLAARIDEMENQNTPSCQRAAHGP